jgi:cell division protein FtsB
MKIFQFLKIKKIFFLQIFLTLYFVINLVGGERGLISYYDKNSYEKKLQLKSFELSKNLDEFENRNTLLAENINIDYLDKLYREKLKFGKKDEILIKLNNDN